MGFGVDAGAGEGVEATSFGAAFLTSPVEVMPAMRVDAGAEGVAPGVELVLGVRRPVVAGALAAVVGALGAVTALVALVMWDADEHVSESK